MERHLDIDISIDGDFVEVSVSEPESSDRVQYIQRLRNVNKLEKIIGNEVVSWVEMMLDEQE